MQTIQDRTRPTTFTASTWARPVGKIAIYMTLASTAWPVQYGAWIPARLLWRFALQPVGIILAVIVCIAVPIIGWFFLGWLVAWYLTTTPEQRVAQVARRPITWRPWALDWVRAL